MNLETLKKFVKQNGDRFIVVENGEPEMVVMSFAEYQKLVGGKTSLPPAETKASAPNLNDQDMVNAELNSLETYEGYNENGDIPSFQEKRPRIRQAMDTMSDSGLPIRLEDIRLEDLPI